MLNKINQRRREEVVRRRIEEQPTLLRSHWVDFNQFAISQKNIHHETWSDDSKNYSGFINTNIDNLLN